MTTILFISTLTLNFAGLIFAGIFLWMNYFGGFSDLSNRNKSSLKIIKISMIISMVFAFLTCLLTESAEITEAISKTAQLYIIIAITWIAVILGCGVLMIIRTISKNPFKTELTDAIKKLFKYALIGAIIALVLAWLFS